MAEESDQTTTPEQAAGLATETVETPSIEEGKSQETTTSETKAEGADQASETSTEDDEEKEERKRESGSQRLRRRLAAVAAEAAEKDRIIEELRRGSSGEGNNDARPGIDREPREDDFPNDYFAFERAKTAWETRQAVRAEFQTQEDVRRRAQLNEARLELREEYEDGLQRARERIPDFDQVMKAMGGVTVPDSLVEEIVAAGKKGPVLAYHLAKNPDDLQRLAGLSGKELAREVGRLEGRVHLPQPKKATEATTPLSQPKGGAAPAFDPFKSDDMSAYVKWRQSGGGKKASA